MGQKCQRMEDCFELYLQKKNRSHPSHSVELSSEKRFSNLMKRNETKRKYRTQTHIWTNKATKKKKNETKRTRQMTWIAAMHRIMITDEACSKTYHRTEIICFACVRMCDQLLDERCTSNSNTTLKWNDVEEYARVTHASHSQRHVRKRGPSKIHFHNWIVSVSWRDWKRMVTLSFAVLHTQLNCIQFLYL